MEDAFIITNADIPSEKLRSFLLRAFQIDDDKTLLLATPDVPEGSHPDVLCVMNEIMRNNCRYALYISAGDALRPLELAALREIAVAFQCLVAITDESPFPNRWFIFDRFGRCFRGISDPEAAEEGVVADLRLSGSVDFAYIASCRQEDS